MVGVASATGSVGSRRGRLPNDNIFTGSTRSQRLAATPSSSPTIQMPFAKVHESQAKLARDAEQIPAQRLPFFFERLSL